MVATYREQKLAQARKAAARKIVADLANDEAEFEENGDELNPPEPQVCEVMYVEHLLTMSQHQARNVPVNRGAIDLRHHGKANEVGKASNQGHRSHSDAAQRATAQVPPRKQTNAAAALYPPPTMRKVVYDRGAEAQHSGVCRLSFLEQLLIISTLG